MARLIVRKADVVKAANSIASQGEMPTIAAIRGFLGGRGSDSTIHLYLKQWRQDLLKKASIGDIKDIATFSVEKQDLEQTIKKQQFQNESLSAEVIELGQENAKLRELRQQSTQNLTNITKELEKSKAQQEKFQALYENIIAERETAIAVIVREQKQQLITLQEELKATNEKGLELVRQTSFDGHQALMDEKVKNINLQEKIKELEAKIGGLQENLRLITNKNNQLLAAKSQPTWEELKAQEKAYANSVFAKDDNK